MVREVNFIWGHCIKSLIKKVLRIPKKYLAKQLGISLVPQIPNPERVFGLEHCSLWPSTRIICHIKSDSQGKVILGKGVYLGRNVELAVSRDSTLSIGDNTSIQDDSVIHGDVEIGRSCAFAKNSHIGSTSHLFREKPYWLIKDQDSTFSSILSHKAWSKKVIIEDDCWIGWGVVVMPGVYIGKGAVVGANSVVTRNIPPYSVQAGTPNAEISKRLDFNPPETIIATNDEHLPYFYKGFDTLQANLLISRQKEIINASYNARMVLKKGEFTKLKIKGSKNSKNEILKLQIFFNGVFQFESKVESDEFAFEISPNNAFDKKFEINDMLKPYNVIDIISDSDKGINPIEQFNYGIQSIALINELFLNLNAK